MIRSYFPINREIAEQDDEKNRKVAEDLTKGLYRTGKNGKMNDIEFSDDEDEERKSKRSKKRRRERDIKGVGGSRPPRCVRGGKS